MADLIVRRLLRGSVGKADPAVWLIVADRYEELGDDDQARTWRRRAEGYPVLRRLLDEVNEEWRRYSDPDVPTAELWGSTEWLLTSCLGWRVAMSRDSDRLMIAADPKLRLDRLNTSSYRPKVWTTIGLKAQDGDAYVVGRLLAAIDLLGE